MANNGNTETGGNAVVTLTPGAYVKFRLIYYNDNKRYRAHKLIYNHS